MTPSTVTTFREREPRVAIIGTGLIGAGWAALFLRQGFGVVAWDPAPGFAAALCDRLRGTFARLGVSPQQQSRLFESLQMASSAAEAVASADFVQESGPESLHAKRQILHELASVADPNTVIASSSSGLRMTDLARGCPSAQRLVVGHPFHPVYLLPLVEVVAGEATSEETVKRAAELYRRAGQTPVICSRDNTGYIGNRLQEAMFREALHMIEAGEATAEQIDTVVTKGPGLRWAFMGPFLSYHLNGGEDGIRGFFERFGDSLLEPYSRLAAPVLTERLVGQVSAAVEAAYGERTPVQLERWRDDRLQRILSVLRAPCDEPGADTASSGEADSH